VKDWTVEVLPSARKDVREPEEGPRKAAVELLKGSAEDPLADEPAEMRGKPNTWKVRFHGDYHLI
jgi:mRNA-degrading endonuclease RelE of RelBE toxin-antitoxin system